MSEIYDVGTVALTQTYDLADLPRVLTLLFATVGLGYLLTKVGKAQVLIIPIIALAEEALFYTIYFATDRFTFPGGIPEAILVWPQIGRLNFIVAMIAMSWAYVDMLRLTVKQGELLDILVEPLEGEGYEE